MTDDHRHYSEDEALDFHASGRPGKIEITPTKPMATQRDLSLAYSPGVAAPVRAIARDPDTAYDYTSKGNLVAVISNGTAVLGLGDLGALASKPVMEGKAVLFKRFADVDAIDLEVDTADPEEFIDCVRLLEPSFGGINLEDLKAPDCFIVEQRLREALKIPVFHDDQHGTAIIAAAGLINALHLTGRDIRDCRTVINGAGAAAIACVELFKAMGLPQDQAILCDSKGVVYQGREDGMNQWKAAHAVDTGMRTLEEAIDGADFFVGLSVKGAVNQAMVASMAENPIIFALANPDPEIAPEEVAEVRNDAIMATGRSDYPNQVNNVLGFPYIFRGALDVRATAINEDMKIAAARALADLAREDVPDEVARAYAGSRPKFGPEYILPVPFDPRLISYIPVAVAKAAAESNVARRPIEDMDAYRATLAARLNPTVGTLQLIFDQLQANPKRVVFAEGEEEKVIRAAISFYNSGYGTPILVGRENQISAMLETLGIDLPEAIQIYNARHTDLSRRYAEWLYDRLQRKGYLFRDCQRLTNTDRNVFAAMMVAHGQADAMITGLTRNFFVSYDQIRLVIDAKEGECVFGLSILVRGGRTVFVADTTVSEYPEAEELADIAEQTGRVARRLGHEPRVALLSFSNFGNPMRERSDRIREAVSILDDRHVDFEFDGEMSADVALNPELRSLYPFCRLNGPANVLIMPGLFTANIASKLANELGGAHLVGPLLIGLEKSVQIAPMGSSSSDIVNMAALAAYEATRDLEEE